MPLYVKKTKSEILRQALEKLERDTPIKAIGPGSVARAFAEAVSAQLGDMYDALDYNLAQSVLSTATGRNLDMLGSLYNVTRRTVSDLTVIDRKLGSFYFYIDAPFASDITIPAGTRVYSATDSSIGRQFAYQTTDTATIRAGRTRVFADIQPIRSDSTLTAGANTLILHNFTSPAGVLVRSTNPKPIAPSAPIEDDDTYRLRIMKSIRVASSGTLEAVRYAALTVNGVRDVRIRSASYGLGSFEVMVIPEDSTQIRQVKTDALPVINAVRPIGVRMFLTEPTYVPIDISVSLIAPSLTTSQRDTLTGRVRLGISRYINNLLPGDTLVYNRLIQAIMESSELIKDVQVTRYAPNGVETIRRNFTPSISEQVITGRIAVSIAQ